MQAKTMGTDISVSKLSASKQPPLIAHIIFRLAVGGLENGLVNLINRIPESQYRHVIISLTDATDFKERITRKDIQVYSLNKKPGHDIGLYIRLWRLLRKLKPAITHTRNLAALEMNIVAILAGVKKRVHSEHGWEINDIHGVNRKHQWLRRHVGKLLHCYIGLSKHIIQYLEGSVGISKHKLTQIYNGVDADRFTVRQNERANFNLLPDGFEQDTIVIGTVGRMQAVKSQTTLAEAFILLNNECEQLRHKLRLIMIGDGELREQIKIRLEAAGIDNQCWLPGSRNDVPEVMSKMDIFVLPSLNEGISNTILEAMATGLPVVATNVGGNPELVIDQITGQLVPADDPYAMMLALKKYVESEQMRNEHGKQAYYEIEKNFRLERMVENYVTVYNRLL